MSNAVQVEQLDCAIDVLLSDPDVAIPNVESTVAELLGVAAELRTLPRPDFRSQLKFRLMNDALGHPELALDMVSRIPSTKRGDPRQEGILPTLFGSGYGTYAVRRSNFVLSVLAHAAVLLLVLTSSFWMAGHRVINRIQLVQAAPVSEYTPIVPASSVAGGGGGGGDRDKMPAPQGRLPKAALEQIATAVLIVRNESPKLAMEPTVVMPPQIHVSSALPNLGDPKSTVLGPPSNGMGAAGGIGSGNGGGIGSGFGGGVGPGAGGGYGGGVFRVGGGVSAPRAIYRPDPEYSPEARQAKYQGTVVVSVIVGADGKTREAHVERSLGMGLDEKAVEAVRQWRFEPALKDGKPVAVAVSIEINFHLY